MTEKWTAEHANKKPESIHVEGDMYKPAEEAQPVANDAEEWGPRLNEATWAAVESWNPKTMGPMSGDIFNNFKRVIRAAILNYCESYTHPTTEAVRKLPRLTDAQVNDVLKRLAESIDHGAIIVTHWPQVANAIMDAMESQAEADNTKNEAVRKLVEAVEELHLAVRKNPLSTREVMALQNLWAALDAVRNGK